MLWVPEKGRLLRQHNLGTIGSTPGTSVTTGAAASTKGSPAEVFASTAFDSYLVEVSAWGYGSSATDSKCCLDVMAGAATEEIIIPDLFVGYTEASSVTSIVRAPSYFFPLYIPAGTRVSVRAAGQRVSTSFRVGINLWGGNAIPPFKVGREVVTYGITVLPLGQSVVPGASAAEGSWTEIVATTSEDHFAVMPGFSWGDDTTKQTRTYYVDIGVGAATEEQVAANYAYGMTGAEVGYGPFPAWPTFIDIPTGTRLTMRVSNSGTNDAGSYTGVIYGVS
jgi:hypothetical protein